MCWRHCDVVGVTVIVPGGNVADVAPHTTDSVASRFTSFDIGWMRNTSSHIDKDGGGCTVGSRAGYFPNPSLTCQSVTCPEVSASVEGQYRWLPEPLRRNGGDRRILGAGVKEINGSRGAIGDINSCRPRRTQCRQKPQFPAGGHERSDRNQSGVVEVDLPNRAGRRA